MISFIILFILSFFIVATGQEDLIAPMGPLAAVIGFALFWKANLFFKKAKSRFLCATFWFILVQCVKQAWLANPEFLGSWIVIFYLIVVSFIGLQFGLVTLLVRKEMSLLYMALIASCWTLMEMLRLLFLTAGYTWNPSGLALTAYTPSLQVASLVGVYGLTFLVILTNLVVFNLFSKPRLKKHFAFAAALILFPYVYGIWHIQYQEANANSKEDSLNALLVQTAILQDERIPLNNEGKALTPIEQWDKVMGLIKPHHSTRFDLIVLPEGSIPYPAYHPIFTHLSVVELFYTHFGRMSLKYLPPLQEPLATWIKKEEDFGGFWAVGNAYVAQSLSNLLKADLLAGFEVIEKNKEGKSQAFQSMVFFKPGNLMQERYDKQGLIPIGESIPFEWCAKIAGYFGVYSFFTPGKETKVFKGKVPIGPSICYEETNNGIMIRSKQLGAKCNVNITNDGWFPGTLLIKQHFAHARVRAIESGIPLLRTCTSGITGGIDSLGRTVKTLNNHELQKAAALNISMPLFHYTTLYEKTGNFLMVSLCFAFIALYFVVEQCKNYFRARAVTQKNVKSVHPS